MINADIVSYVEQSILPRYLCFDAAHQINHVTAVIEESVRLARFYDVDMDMVYVIAAYHDLGLCAGRERHHIVSGEILMSDDALKSWFDDKQLLVMRDAIEDHRASNKHEPRSVYGRIVAEADRQIDADVTLRRTVQYGLSKYPELSNEGQFERAYDHVKNKYGEGGYLKLYIPESPNAERLEAFRKLIDSAEDFRKAFDTIYEQEVSCR